MSSGLCSTCVSSRWCSTWSEIKCVKHAKRFSTFGFSQPAKCSDYEKRDKNFKELPCQCDNCLRNEKLFDELEEGDDD